MISQKMAFKRIAPVLISVSKIQVLQAQIRHATSARDYSTEVIHKTTSEPNNRSESLDTVKTESEQNDDNIKLVSSNDMELG